MQFVTACITLSISDFETTTVEKLCKCSLGTATSPLDLKELDILHTKETHSPLVHRANCVFDSPNKQRMLLS